jgi:ADP-ribose pyrophosphatase
VTDAAARYAALRLERPELFEGDGPVRLDDREPGVDEGVVHENRWFMVVADPVLMPDGRPGSYRRIVPASSGTPVAILPVTPDGGVILLEHWRHATRSWHLEIPRGYGEDHVSAIDQAAAELREELGIEGEIEALGTIHTDTGIQAAEVALFVAHLGADAVPDHGEGLARVVVMDASRFRRAILDNDITDPFAIAAWTRLTIMRGQA